MKYEMCRILVFMLIFGILITACGENQQPVNSPEATAKITNQAGSTESSFSATEEPTSRPTATLQESTPAPQDGQVRVIEMNSFKDESDYWYFHGLVRNDTDKVINGIQVEVSLFDIVNTQVYSYTTYTNLTYLEPGEISPFSDFTTEQYPDAAEMQADVIGYQTSDGIQHARLDFNQITLWADEYNDVYLAGVATNGSEQPVEINSIAGTLVDSSGKIVSSAVAYPNLTYVESGGNSPFVMMFDAPIGEAANLTQYQLFADALATDPISPFDIEISERHEKYQDANGDLHLVGSVTNNDTNPLNIFLVAGLFDQDGNCVDANVVYLPMPLNPGETFPYDFSSWGAADYVPEAYGQVTDYKIFVDWLSTFEGSPTFKLSTKDDVNSFDGSIGRFTGTVVNNSGQDLDSALVSVSLVDKASGRLMATNLNFVTEALSKDASGSYEVYVYPPNDFDPQKIDIQIVALGQ